MKKVLALVVIAGSITMFSCTNGDKNKDAEKAHKDSMDAKAKADSTANKMKADSAAKAATMPKDTTGMAKMKLDSAKAAGAAGAKKEDGAKVEKMGKDMKKGK